MKNRNLTLYSRGQIFKFADDRGLVLCCYVKPRDRQEPNVSSLKAPTQPAP